MEAGAGDIPGRANATAVGSVRIRTGGCWRTKYWRIAPLVEECIEVGEPRIAGCNEYWQQQNCGLRRRVKGKVQDFRFRLFLVVCDARGVYHRCCWSAGKCEPGCAYSGAGRESIKWISCKSTRGESVECGIGAIPGRGATTRSGRGGR